MGIYVLILIPAQVPGEDQTGVMGQLLQWINPLAAVNHFLSKILVNNIKFSEFLVWLEAPVAFAILILGMLFMYAAPGLRLQEGRGSRLWMRFSRAVGLGMIVAAIFITGTSSALALQTWTDPDQPLQISINMESKTVKASDSIFFDTVVTNTTAEASPMIFVAMNIINLEQEGEPIDPEDWSPERTQSIDSLAAGQSVTLSWRVNAILDGDVLIYMVAIPQPEGQHVIRHPIASPGVHLTVTQFFTKLSPMGVLPVAMGGPLLLLLIIYFVNRRRNQNVDMGGSL